MARFEVFIPPAEADGLSLTLRVTADSWMAALKIGLRKIGEGGSMPQNVLCDVQEDESIHVTDPRTNRVFRIVELPEVSDPGLEAVKPSKPEAARAAPSPEWLKAPTATPIETKAAPDGQAVRAEQERLRREKAEREKAETEQAERARIERELTERERTEKEKAEREQGAKEKAERERAAREKIERGRERAEREKAERERLRAEEARARAQDARAALAVKVVEVPAPRSQPPPQIGREPAPPADGVEDALIDLFERTPAVFGKPRDEGLYFLLDLAMEKIPAEAGSVYVADLNRRDLRFAAARGPKADELLRLGVTVPMGRGFVGFCAQEGVGIAVSDAQRDPRHFSEVSVKLGYAIHSVITTPVLVNGRTLGAIQLLNKKGSSSFSSAELSMLHYVAHQAAVYLEASGE